MLSRIIIKNNRIIKINNKILTKNFENEFPYKITLDLVSVDNDEKVTTVSYRITTTDGSTPDLTGKYIRYYRLNDNNDIKGAYFDEELTVNGITELSDTGCCNLQAEILDNKNTVVSYKSNKLKIAADCISTVKIEGKTYKTVTFRGQTWLAENLAVETESSIVNEEHTNFGRYYTWDDAMSVANSIEGWHVPSMAEWELLVEHAGGDIIKLCSKDYWAIRNGTDDYSMNILPGGGYSGGEFKSVLWIGEFWSSDEKDNSLAKGVSFDQGSELNTFTGFKGDMLHIRLVKDA